MSKKVIAAGHICLDITPVLSHLSSNAAALALNPGRLTEAHGADIHTGGSVANTGLALKLLGCDVSLMGKVGRDSFGDMVCSLLEGSGAGQGMLRVSGESTSYSVVIALPGVDRIFLHDPGANNTFCADDIPDEALRDAALFHLGYPPLMRAMYESGGAGLIRLLEKVKAAGCAVSMDMAAISPGSDAAAADWDAILRRAIPLTDLFMPSAEELCFMLEPERLTEWQQRATGRDIAETLDMERDIRPLADKCMRYGAGVLVVKCGVAGLYCRTAGEERLSFLRGLSDECDVSEWADFEGHERCFKPTKALSATGAGDTSIAAFLAAVLRGFSPQRALRLAAAEGACCVEAYDSLSSLLSLDALEARINAGWERQ